MIFGKCAICGEWGFTESHRCPPAWYAWTPADDYEEEGEHKSIYAFSAEDAAEKFAEQWDEYSEYWLVDGEYEEREITVVLTPAGNHKAQRHFSVTAYSQPVYRAREKETPCK